MDVSVPRLSWQRCCKKLCTEHASKPAGTGLMGQMTVGMLNGYDKVRNAMSIEVYYEK